MEALYWLLCLAVVYAYLGYPVALWLLVRVRRPVLSATAAADGTYPWPTVSLIVPVHNEESVIARKLQNTASLTYLPGKLEVLFVSDGSTDRTVEIINSGAVPGVKVLELGDRGGKARALNRGLGASSGEIVCFSDASIMLAPDALEALIANFRDPIIGCVSGEDVIEGTGGERLYGLYELAIRRLESRLHSIVGASGSFYAQRRFLCGDFREGLAPDFLSVLKTVEHGHRAISEPAARGTMTSLPSSRAEFKRKVRTLLRGMSTLVAHRDLLNPLHFGLFAFELFSHKLVRWLVPFFLVGLLFSNVFLLESGVYAAFLAIQLAFYATALLAWIGVPRVGSSLIGRVALYFTVVNAATLVAWWKFFRGARQEIWSPSRRESAES